MMHDLYLYLYMCLVSIFIINISASGKKQWMVDKEKVGFIGLGNMGGGMAKNLVQKGHDVVAYDVCQDAVCIPLKRGLGKMAEKLQQVGTPSEVAAQARVIMILSNLPCCGYYKRRINIITLSEWNYFLPS